MRSGRGRAVAVLCGVLAVVGALVGLTTGVLGGPTRADLASPSTTRATPDPAAAAADLLFQLEQGLAGNDRAALRGLSDPDRPGSTATVAALAHNVQALRLTDLAFRYIDASDVELGAAERRRYGEDAFVSDVQVTWRLRGVDRTASSLEVPLVLDWQDDRAVLEGALDGAEGRVPLWLLDRVQVRRTRAALVLATDGAEAAAAHRQAGVAVATIRQSLPRWRGPLVVEVPATRSQFEAAAGVSRGEALAIAAVTTSTDGSGLAASPVHIYLNPPVFEPLGERGRQIVISHEAAHVALGAATSPAPLWISEGIADQLALVDTTIPDRVLAAQIIALVRKEGAPSRLPGRAEFDGSNRDIGAWYEAAWLAARLIAEEHGQDSLLAFYRAADREGDTRRAFAEVLDTDQRDFVQQWRAQLVALSGRPVGPA